MPGSFQTGNVGPGNFSTLQTLTTAKYLQENLFDNISSRSTLAKFFADSDVNDKFREQLGMRPRRRPFHSGQQIEVPVRYQLGTSKWINGSTPLDTARHEYATIGKYQWKEFVSPPVSLNRRIKAINAGNETKILDVMLADTEQSMISMIEDLETAMGGTNASDSNQVLGLRNLVEDSSTSTIGGINRTTNSFWQNQTFTTTIANFGTSFAGFRAMEELWQDVERGAQVPDVIFTTKDIQRYYRQFLVENGTWNTFEHPERSSDLGRGTPWFHGAPVVQTTGVAAEHMYMLNTDTIFLTFMEGQDFVETGMVQEFGSFNQVSYIYLMAAFLVTEPARNGVITDIDAY